MTAWRKAEAGYTRRGLSRRFKAMAELTLVTGADGFVGRVLVDYLVDKGLPVRALVLPGRKVPAAWAGQVEVVRGDVTRSADVRRAVAGVSAVQHLAAAVGDWIPWEIHQAVTVDGTRNLIDAVCEQACRLILTSSVTVYGDRIRAGPCDESLPHGRPMGHYSRAKQAQERLVEDCRRHREFDAVIVRPGNIYGPACGPWLLDLGRALRRGVPALISDHAARAGLVHVTSVASLLLAAQQRAPAGSVFNACDELDVTWCRYFTDIARLVQAPSPRRLPYRLAWMLAPLLEHAWSWLGRAQRPPITREAFNLVAHDNLFPATRARTTLGWRPAVSYDTALGDIEAYLARHPL
ncbi:MAG: NAD-dependent epimerase/dehydratase family protein [Wenzhouxiangella sp.]|nr:MAG: NAD-dependent epimerase/dehydratase family protein [Wenzhouxiangella sp.]